MRPKKRDKPILEEQKPKFEQIQADHELFLQAFEKPTQIYRYLRSRHLIAPIFLQRTLSYMKGRCKRTKKNRRSTFKVDNILEKVETKHRKDHQIHSSGSSPYSLDCYKSEYLNLTFTGFFDKDLDDSDKVEVEANLLKMCHKKRKDVSSPVMQVHLGKVEVRCNPECATPSKAEALAVGSQHFLQNNGHAVRSYILVIRVRCTYHAPTATPPTPDDSLCNGSTAGEETNDEEPHPKRRRTSRLTSTGEIKSSVEPEPQRSTDEEVLYGAELVVYDRYRRCQLTDGDYELALQDLETRDPPKSQATWETVLDGKVVGPFEVFHRCPTLKFKLSWGKTPLQGLVESPAPIPLMEDRINLRHNNHLTECDNVVPKECVMERRARDILSPKRRRIFYQFLYNNNTRQQTEARDDLHCPWCSVNCMQLYGLLKHLRTCHARFNFVYVEHPKGTRIDVSINDCFDGSYAGNPQDLHSHIGFAFSRTGPVRRTPVTHFIVYKSKRPSFQLSEFLEPETESHSTRQFIQGHSRLYFHTLTHQPLRPQEIDIDSEGENDPYWLRQKTMKLIDEFTDVNEGEKEIMKMWNLHVMHHNYIGDCQIQTACETFVTEYGERILQRNLTRNLTLHFTSLYDFGLIKATVIYTCKMQLFRLRDTLEAQGRLPATSDAVVKGKSDSSSQEYRHTNRS